MERISQVVLTFLLNAAWQLTLITAVAALCDLLLRRTSSRYRHRLWVAALFLSFGLSIFSISPQLRDAFTPVQPVRVELAFTTIPSSPLSPGEVSGSRPDRWWEGVRIIEIDSGVANGLIALCLLCWCYYGLKLLRAWRRTRTIRRSIYRIECQDHIQAIIGRCQEALGVKGAGIWCSAGVTTPITVGVLSPLIIVPERLLREADTELLTSAIGHELAHVSRNDYFFNLIYELIYLPLWFHPAAALMRRRIRETRELSCDELVVGRLLKADVYARSLVRLAGSAIASGCPATAITLGITDADILEERIMTILRRPKISVRRNILLLVSAVLIFTVPGVAAASYSRSFSIATQYYPEMAVWDGRGQGRDAADVRSEVSESQSQEGEQARKVDARQRVSVRKADSQGGSVQHSTQSQDGRSKEEIRAEQSQKEFLVRLKAAQAKAEHYRKKIIVESQAFHAKLAKKAVITMQQAIQIATAQVPGKVVECSLLPAKESVVYHILIFTEEGTSNSTTNVVVDAVTGEIATVDKTGEHNNIRIRIR